MAGKGHYGDIFLAKAFGIVDNEPESLVSFKALLSREEAHQFEFRRELEMYARLNHENVTRLLGISRETEPFFLIFEYLEWVRRIYGTYFRKEFNIYYIVLV